MLINTNDEIQYIGTKENGQPLTAVIVDDSMAMVKIVSRTLSDFGFNILGSASNGEEIIDVLNKITEDVDLITLDITMPKKDGLAVLPELVKMKPKTKIVMVSALGDKNRVIQAMQMGAHYYIVKPFRKETFYVVLRRIFKN
ncbi:MAG: response regulator [Candidatus Margulisbacteria bacterium]|nr:response regulator [Candidatus Margulisiibacteriota bacterium]